MAAGTFTGFGDDALFFYQGLEADNSRSYWTGHAELYERAVKEPMTALIAALEPEFGQLKFFRPYRDVRFSADKTPYKTHAGALSQPDDGAGAHYLQLGADGLMLAGGFYRMSRDQLERYRAAVLDDATGGELAAVTAKLQKQGFALHGEQLKRAPRGVDPGHPRLDLLRRKGIAAFHESGTPDWLATPRAKAEIAKVWRRIAPLNDWLRHHVGAPEPVEGDVTARVRR